MSPTILVVADGTPEGAGAMRFARMLAEREGARVEVLAVHDPGALRIVRGEDPAVPLSPPPAEKAVRELRERVRAQLRRSGGDAENWPLTVQVGGTARTIAGYALDCGASRVVLGLGVEESTQRWVTREMLLDLVPRLQVPILAVPSGYLELPRSVVVGVDFSKYSLEVAREAVEDLDEGAQLHLVHVVDEDEVYRTEADRLTAERQLTELASELELPGIVAVEAHIRVGDPADEILALAREVGAELIAAGSHGATYPGQVLTGDVWGKLVHLANQPLLLGPPRGMRVSRQEWDDDFTLQPLLA